MIITCEQLHNVNLLEEDVHQRTVASGSGLTKAVIHPLAADSGVPWAHFL